MLVLSTTLTILIIPHPKIHLYTIPILVVLIFTVLAADFHPVTLNLYNRDVLYTYQKLITALRLTTRLDTFKSTS
jgi:hypothetical protein